MCSSVDLEVCLLVERLAAIGHVTLISFLGFACARFNLGLLLSLLVWLSLGLDGAHQGVDIGREDCKFSLL